MSRSTAVGQFSQACPAAAGVPQRGREKLGGGGALDGEAL
jgi:hypothetical protein